MNAPLPKPPQRASRAKLLLIAAVFAAPIIAAGLLTVSGWQPEGKGNGLPITPQRNFVAEPVTVKLADGSVYAWRDAQPRLTLIALVGPACAARCVDTLTKMAAARVTLARNMPRLRLLLLGTPPANEPVQDGRVALGANPDASYLLGSDVDGKLAAFVPSTPDSVSAVLVESNGTALSFYPAGFDTTGLRKDLQKVIR
ncbi:MAG TPA: hypothetical protein VFW82_00015 [Dyella sp.]|nr:hypothetical protein [Dyella sp.]